MIFKNIKYMYCNDTIYENLLWNHLFLEGAIFMDFLGTPLQKELFIL